MVRNRIIPIFIPHVGCPHRCVFCDQRRIAGRQRPVRPEEAAAILRAALPKSGAGAEAAFYGGSFTAVEPAYQEALLEAVRPFREDGSIASVRVSTRPDCVDGAALERLRRGGVRTVELGCQSMDDRVLAACGRGHTRGDVLRAAALLRAAGFRVILQMMTGLPGDTAQTARETAEALAALRPDGVRLYPTVVIRGTELHERYLQGAYTPQTVEEAVDQCAALLPVFLDAGIPVLRIGLQPTAELSGGAAAAGAYHPALGELVKSRVYRSRAEGLLAARRGAPSAVLGVSPNRISLMTGQKRCNLRWLEARFSIGAVRVVPAAVEDWRIVLQSAAEIDKISR